MNAIYSVPVAYHTQRRDAASASAGKPADTDRHEVGDRHQDEIHARQLRSEAVEQVWDQEQVDQHREKLIEIVRCQPREIRADHDALRVRSDKSTCLRTTVY